MLGLKLSHVSKGTVGIFHIPGTTAAETCKQDKLLERNQNIDHRNISIIHIQLLNKHCSLFMNISISKEIIA